MSTATLVALAASLIVAHSTTGHAKPGDLDASFDEDGVVVTDFGSAFEYGDSVAVQSDGKALLAGYTYGAYDLEFAVIRYNTDGSVDTSFGGDGIATLPAAHRGYATIVAIQGDGKIVAAGDLWGDGAESDPDFAIARYNVDGSLDSSFDGDGIVITTLGASSEQVRAAVIQTDGKIVVAGHSSNGSDINVAVARYNSDGSPDSTFDGDGVMVTSQGVAFQYAGGLAVQADGKMLLSGYSSVNNDNDFAVVRYNADGSLDTSFDADGIVATDLGSNSDYASSVVIQDDAKIVAVGQTSNQTGGSAVAIVRYNANGSLDTSFDGDGRVITDPAANDAAGESVIVQATGELVVVAYASTQPGAAGVAVIRYNADGSLDTTFDNDGVLQEAESFGYNPSIAIRGDGKLVVAWATNDNNTGAGFVLARHDSNGALDSGFGAEGVLRIAASAHGNAVAIQDDGKIVVAGSVYNEDWDFAVTRYNPDGSLDTTLDGDGMVTTDFGSSSDSANSVAIQSDGKIVLTGGSTVARYNPDGSLDTTFGGDGVVTTNLVTTYAVAIQADGRIVVAGYSYETTSDLALARYNADGSLDTSFDDDGVVSTDRGIL